MATQRLVVGLGEALYDVFASHELLGGAPLNAAFHAQQLLAPHAGQGVVVSRVGTDRRGDAVLRELSRAGLETAYVQQDTLLPTGTVLVTESDGEPQYEIVADVAWDHLEWTPQLSELARQAAAVVFGTLAQRSDVSQSTIQRFISSASGAVRLFDVNLRQHYYDATMLDRSCQLATCLKLNDQELPIVAAALRESTESADDVARALLARYELSAVALTRGAQGTVCYTASGRFEGAPAAFPPQAGADHVGAGDACTAGLLAGWLLGASPQDTVDLANRLGAAVASLPGATPQLPADLLDLRALL